MNRLCLYIGIFIFSYQSFAQNLHVDSNNFVAVNSYSGVTKSDAFRVWIDGTGALNLPTWRVSVRIVQPISNGDQVFPADKLSLLPTATYGQFNCGNVPTVSQIGMPLQSFLQMGLEVFLVPQSQAGLCNTASGGQYYNFYMPFDLKIEGGSYLAAFTTWSQFSAVLEFKFYDEHNNIRGTVQSAYQIQIATLSGTPPDPTPQFSLTVDNKAVNGLLELRTRADYIQGAQVVYDNGLAVNANTDYQLKVKSLQGSFISNIGNTLPLDVIQLSLGTSSGTSSAVFPIWLSAASQKIATGNATQGVPVYYDIKYASKPNDVNLITAKTDQYSTTLQYEIIPQ